MFLASRASSEDAVDGTLQWLGSNEMQHYVPPEAIVPFALSL
jgi:hypothetical protein